MKHPETRAHSEPIFGAGAHHKKDAHSNMIGKRIDDRGREIFNTLRLANELVTRGAPDEQVVKFLSDNNIGPETLKDINSDEVLAHKMAALTEGAKLLALMATTEHAIALDDRDLIAVDDNDEGIEAAA